MLIIKMLLCASVVMLGQLQATESKPQPKTQKKIEKNVRYAAGLAPPKTTSTAASTASSTAAGATTTTG